MNPELEALFDKYQKFCITTAIYPEAGTKSKMELIYLCLGLLGEQQEWQESEGNIKEAGDILWYLSQLCTYLGTDLYLLYTNSNCKGNMYGSNIFESLKKHIRDDKNISDVVYFLLMDNMYELKYHYHYSINNPPLDETFKLIIMQNVDKLTDRKNRGMLQGSGDDR